MTQNMYTARKPPNRETVGYATSSAEHWGRAHGHHAEARASLIIASIDLNMGDLDGAATALHDVAQHVDRARWAVCYANAVAARETEEAGG